jgi:hypothetical protein
MAKDEIFDKPIENKKEFFLVDDLSTENKIEPWEIEGVKRYKNWLPGKSVTRKEFNQAVEEFRNKPLGD